MSRPILYSRLSQTLYVDVLVWGAEWGKDGVRVNAVVPGPIAETEGMTRLAPTEEARNLVSRSVPLGRWGSVVNIAYACQLLASPLATYITGAVLPVGGGWSLGWRRHFDDQRPLEPGTARKPKMSEVGAHNSKLSCSICRRQGEPLRRRPKSQRIGGARPCRAVIRQRIS